MFISNFVLPFCATAIIFLNSADALQLDIGGLIGDILGGGEERRTHTFTRLTCPADFGSGLYRCQRQVNARAFFLERIYYRSGTAFCSHRIVCELNGNLRTLRNQYPPNGTPCGDEFDATSACFQRRCLAAQDPQTAPTCERDAPGE